MEGVPAVASELLRGLLRTMLRDLRVLRQRASGARAQDPRIRDALRAKQSLAAMGKQSAFGQEPTASWAIRENPRSLLAVAEHQGKQSEAE